MIARRLPKDPEVADNFTRLAEYIAAAKDEGEKLDRFWLRNCNAGTGMEDLETALVEIDAVRRMKPAVKDKTYHLLISFRAEDRKDLSTEALRDIEQHFAEALGFGEHQRVAATHVNTDHFHMHVAINRVHPESLKIHNPLYDFRTLATCCHEMERRYGLAADRGRAEDLARRQERLSPAAQDFERHTWQQSFQRHLLSHREAILAGVKAADTWKAVHQAFAAHDAALRLRGNGLVVVHSSGKQAMKASALHRSCSKAALEKRFGPFQPAQVQEAGKVASPPPRRRYKARPLSRHAATARLWRGFLAQQRRRQAGLLRRMPTWKTFLLAAAIQDPLALVALMAQQELIATLLGQRSEAPPAAPRPVPKLLTPALAHWRQASRWTKARPGMAAAPGTMVDEAGHVIVPQRDRRSGAISGIAVISPDGRRALHLGQPPRRSRALDRDRARD